jgi:CheY-like chemotaxis protein
MSKHVVVVDDDPMIRFLLQEYLKALGFSVDAYSAGREALEALANTTPDLIVLDLQMPEMNGIEVLTHLRQHPSTANTPVLMLSANATEARSDTSISADCYLEKPFQIQDLLSAVQSTVRGE